jgi:hypothetical protein
MTSCHYCNTPDDGYFEEDAKGNVICSDCLEGHFYCTECNYHYGPFDLSEIPETCVNCAKYKEN